MTSFLLKDFSSLAAVSSVECLKRCLLCPDEVFFLQAYVKTIFCDELTYWMVFRKEMSLSLAFADAIQLADKSEATTPVTPVTATKPPLEKSLSEPNIHALTVRGLKQIFNDLNEAHQFNGHESAALKMINIAKSPDNLCRMDPSWHPWL